MRATSAFTVHRITTGHILTVAGRLEAMLTQYMISDTAGSKRTGLIICTPISIVCVYGEACCKSLKVIQEIRGPTPYVTIKNDLRIQDTHSKNIAITETWYTVHKDVVSSRRMSIAKINFYGSSSRIAVMAHGLKPISFEEQG